MASSGDSLLALIQPVSGASVFTDFLAAQPNGGVRHVAYMVPLAEFEAAVAPITQEGNPVIQSLVLPVASVVFFDKGLAIGVVTEIIGVTAAGGVGGWGSSAVEARPRVRTRAVRSLTVALRPSGTQRHSCETHTGHGPPRRKMIRETVLSTVGVLLILVVLRDVMHELFHPEQTGSMSKAVTRGVWSAIRAAARHRRSMIFRAGPLILVSVMAVWVVLLVFGFALIYWPRLPGSFNVDPALHGPETEGFWTALYVSMASFTTLSAGGLAPRTSGMRTLVTLESFVGPVIFTAWITWVLGIYPVLADRRTFTRQADGLRQARADPEQLLDDAPPEAVAEMLRSLTEQTLSVGARLQQASVTYYFQNESEEAALAMQLPYLLALARVAEARGPAPAIRHHGTMLRVALEQLLKDMGEQYVNLRDVPAEQVIDAIAKDHLLPPPTIRRKAKGR